MREVLYKNIVSMSSRKKDISVKEVYEKNGITARTERRCFYYIKEITSLKEVSDPEGFIQYKNMIEPVNRRHFHILKERKDGVGEDKLICKIIGTFYIIINNCVYTIAFLHSFKVCFVKSPMAN